MSVVEDMQTAVANELGHPARIDERNHRVVVSRHDQGWLAQQRQPGQRGPAEDGELLHQVTELAGPAEFANQGRLRTRPAAIDFAGTDGVVTFGDVTITGLAANTTGVDYTGATLNGNVTFHTLNITGASVSGTKGIDFGGQTTAKNVITTESGNISGVGIGVDLTNANITGTFQYGDGSNTDADGAASAITATTPIVITGMNGINGTYNFLDVVLTGDVSSLSSTVTAYYVDNVTDTRAQTSRYDECGSCQQRPYAIVMRPLTIGVRLGTKF